MAQRTSPLLPASERLLQQLGDRLRLARLRRRLTAKQVGQRAGMSPMTLRSVERGGSGVTIGAYLAVMQVLGVERDLDLLLQADTLGRDLQDARLPTRRALPSPRTQAAARARRATWQHEPPARGRETERKTQARKHSRRGEDKKGAQTWIQDGGFASAESLADIIDAPSTGSKKRR